MQNAEKENTRYGAKHRLDVDYRICVLRKGTHEGERDEVCTDVRVDERSEDHAGFAQQLAAEVLTLIPYLERFSTLGRINEVRDDG